MGARRLAEAVTASSAPGEPTSGIVGLTGSTDHPRNSKEKDPGPKGSRPALPTAPVPKSPLHLHPSLLSSLWWRPVSYHSILPPQPDFPTCNPILPNIYCHCHQEFAHPNPQISFQLDPTKASAPPWSLSQDPAVRNHRNLAKAHTSRHLTVFCLDCSLMASCDLGVVGLSLPVGCWRCLPCTSQKGY